MKASIAVAVLALLVAASPSDEPKKNRPEPPRAKALIPQVWIDTQAKVFHSPGCPKITPLMASRARTIAKAQGIAPAPECAMTDTEAAKRWSEELKVGNAPGSKPAGGFAIIGDGKVPPPTTTAKPTTTPTTRPQAQQRSRVGPVSTEVSRTAVMAASDFYDAERVLTSACTARWRTDAEMRAYCIEKQRAAVSALKQGRPFGADEARWGRARVECAQRWPTDYDMRLYCEGHAE